MLKRFLDLQEQVITFKKLSLPCLELIVLRYYYEWLRQVTVGRWVPVTLMTSKNIYLRSACGVLRSVPHPINVRRAQEFTDPVTSWNNAHGNEPWEVNMKPSVPLHWNAYFLLGYNYTFYDKQSCWPTGIYKLIG